MALIPISELSPYIRFPASDGWRSHRLRFRTIGTRQLTVKVYGHLQPGANRHWINNLPGAAATVVSAVAAD